MKAWLTKDRLAYLVDNYVRTCDESETKEVAKVYNHICSAWIDYDGEEVQGYATTYWDEVAYQFHKWGCYVSVTYDWVDGSPTWTISLPQSREEEVKNKEIFAETWG